MHTLIRACATRMPTINQLCAAHRCIQTASPRPHSGAPVVHDALGSSTRELLRDEAPLAADLAVHEGQQVLLLEAPGCRWAALHRSAEIGACADFSGAPRICRASENYGWV